MHEVLVNRVGGLGLPRKSVVRLTDRPDMTLDDLETMSLREMGPQLKLPINVTNGSMPLQCNTYF